MLNNLVFYFRVTDQHRPADSSGMKTDYLKKVFFWQLSVHVIEATEHKDQNLLWTV